MTVGGSYLRFLPFNSSLPGSGPAASVRLCMKIRSDSLELWAWVQVNNYEWDEVGGATWSSTEYKLKGIKEQLTDHPKASKSYILRSHERPMNRLTGGRPMAPQPMSKPRCPGE